MSVIVDSLPVPMLILKSMDTDPRPSNSKFRFTWAVVPLHTIEKFTGLSSMVGSFRKDLVTGISKHIRLGLASHISKDPEDPDKIPIGPEDCVESVNRAASRRPVVVAIKRRFLDFFVQPHEHHAQQIVGHVLTVRHALADCAGLFKQGFGFGLFHSSTVGRLAVK